nr:amino acid transporter AVT6A-like [Populus alba]
MTSLCGFLLFGDSTLDDMLANFDTDLGVPYSSLLNDIVCISYALHLMLVFHVIFHPLRLNLGGLLFPSATPLVSDNDRFSLIITALISLIFLGANFIPNIWVAFQFTGATSAACLGFIFLAAIALRDPHFAAAKKDKVIHSKICKIFGNCLCKNPDLFLTVVFCKDEGAGGNSYNF